MKNITFLGDLRDNDLYSYSLTTRGENLIQLKDKHVFKNLTNIELT